MEAKRQPAGTLRGRALVTPLALVVLVTVGAFGWLSWRVYRARTAPEAARLDGPSWAWSLGPTPASLKELGQTHVDRGLAALADRGLPAAERMALAHLIGELGVEPIVAIRDLVSVMLEGMRGAAASRPPAP